MRFGALAAVAAAIAGAGALAQPEEGPEAFVGRLYAGYEQPDFNVFAQADQVFAAGLIAAMAENDRCTPDDEVGAVDFDPLCQCQDPAEMRARVGEVRRLSADQAEASVQLGWPEPRGREALHLDLVREGGRWKVADLHSQAMPSFLEHVQADNRRACAAR